MKFSMERSNKFYIFPITFIACLRNCTLNKQKQVQQFCLFRVGFLINKQMFLYIKDMGKLFAILLVKDLEVLL